MCQLYIISLIKKNGHNQHSDYDHFNVNIQLFYKRQTSFMFGFNCFFSSRY